jgi:predicted membrane channel-forming protein YqfA (hemolysin III family)
MEWNFGDVFLTMLVFFFWILFIWMFIAIFADIFRRRDLSGWGKAGWTLMIFVLPVIGVLAYMVARPKVTPEDAYLVGRGFDEATYPYSSPADEISKLSDLHDKGAISDAEYESLKARAVA